MEIKVRLTEPHRRQHFAIMVTRETHCFDALMAAKLKADAALVKAVNLYPGKRLDVYWGVVKEV